MTAHDPAIEAAQRVRNLGLSKDIKVAAAREALKPIRELHQKFSVRSLGFADDQPRIDICGGCSDIGVQVPWPCETAKLIYTSEELER